MHDVIEHMGGGQLNKILLTSSCSAFTVGNLLPLSSLLSFGKNPKSQGAMSGELGGWGRRFKSHFLMCLVMWNEVWGEALSWWIKNLRPPPHKAGLFFPDALLELGKSLHISL